MEGQGEKPPTEAAPKQKSGMNKMLVIIVVIILIAAAILGALYWMDSNASPSISVSTDTEVVNAGEAVTLTATADDNTNVFGQDLEYLWKFGDGLETTTTAKTVDHTYSFPGMYMVWVQVKSSNGQKADNFNELVEIEVLNPVPPASPDQNTTPYALAVASGDIIASGDLVSFDGNSSGAYDSDGLFDNTYITNYTWSFGDGSALAYGSPVNHTYTADKTVNNAYLKVKNAAGIEQRYYICIKVGGEVGAVKNPDTFTLVTIGEPDNLDPAVDYETAGGEVIQNCYETLVWYDGSSAANLIPMLATAVPTAENGGISADGLTYTFNLRSGVKFHNGETMTSADVVYSIKRVLMIDDPDGPAWMLGQVLIPDYYDLAAVPEANCSKAIWAVDSDTVQFNLTMPYPAFIYIMAYTVGSVVSMKFVEDNGGITLGEQSQFMNENCCGTGPFTMDKWVRNQQILLKRNDAYWSTPAQLQYVIIKKANDYGTRLMMLQAGDADSAFVPRIHESDVSSNDNMRIVKDLPTFNLDFMGLNQNINMAKNPAAGTDTIPSNFFADLKVRRAFAHAFDYQTAIDTYFLGGAVQPNGIIPAGMFGYNATVPVYEFNLTMAADFLNQAQTGDGDTWGERGFTLTLMYNAGNEWRSLECQLLKEGLEQLQPLGLIDGNLEINTQALDWPVYLDTLQGKGLPAFFLGWAPDYADPDDYINPFIHGSGTYAKRCSIVNDTLTTMCTEAASELNPDVRAEMYYDISMAVYDNCYYIWTAQATNFHVERTWVSGYYFNPMYPGLYFYTYSK